MDDERSVRVPGVEATDGQYTRHAMVSPGSGLVLPLLLASSIAVVVGVTFAMGLAWIAVIVPALMSAAPATACWL